ncbi:hypothetical protein ACHAW5_004400 [Stephanodiscus triporus]|uniref:H(+)-exporting diphosphatase n=1 Tax=Stephanodiscus triporus TaxID=2934178 RepID=A0ABD3QIZ2_9STRA
MAVKDNYSFEPVGAVDPDTSMPVLAEAIPEQQGTAGEDDKEHHPSDAAIMVGMGLVGWVIGGPFLAIITALGGKYAADKQNKIGESCVAVGRIAEAAGKKAKEERLFDKLKTALHSMFSKKDGHA